MALNILIKSKYTAELGYAYPLLGGYAKSIDYYSNYIISRIISEVFYVFIIILLINLSLFCFFWAISSSRNYYVKSY